MKTIYHIFFPLCIFFQVQSQDSLILKENDTLNRKIYDVIQGVKIIDEKENFSLHGYIKNLESIGFGNRFKNASCYNLLHNRINFKWHPTNTLYFTAEFRNRIYWGNELKGNVSFASYLKNSNEGFNMQKLWFSTSNYYLHSNVERLYMDLTLKKINVRIGRQRINWGIANTWNPNDIFNSFNFLDVDYEERPGADAIKLKYLPGGFSEFEFVYNYTSNRKSISSIRYFFNKWKYDFQIIGGWFKNRFTFGLGSSGNIGKYGFRNELQLFSATNSFNTRLNIATDIDRLFEKGWFLQIGLLYNNLGITKPLTSWNLIDLKITPENIMPSRWNLITGFRKEVSPIFNVGSSFVYAPGMDLFIFLPRITYNLNENLDADCIWQSFFMKQQSVFTDMKHICMVRLKYNF